MQLIVIVIVIVIVISRLPLKNHAHQGPSLFTSAATNQSFFPKGGQEKLRSDFQRARRGQISSSCLKVGVAPHN